MRWTGALAALFLVGACRADAKPRPGAQPEDPAGVCNDEPDAAPGCGAEWCAEHGVPEADCAQCKADGGRAHVR